MNLLVTGGAGYLGSVLIPKLLVRGHQVRILDIGYFGLEHLRAMRSPGTIIRRDIRNVLAEPAALENLLRGVDAVIHLAAISNDPSADLHPRLIQEVNFEATRDLALACRLRGIRLVVSSSCSVYGAAPEQADENSPTHPLTLYARSKLESDNFLLGIANRDWRPVILRSGTLYGLSPRMRFDLVINIFCYCSSLYNEVRIFGDGLQWRPMLHVADFARALIRFVENPNHQHLVYNLASENLRVVDLIRIFKEINPACREVFVTMENPDARNYHVSTARMTAEEFRPRVDIRTGAEEIIEAIMEGRIADPEAVLHRNAKWLKELGDLGGRDDQNLIARLDVLVKR